MSLRRLAAALAGVILVTACGANAAAPIQPMDPVQPTAPTAATDACDHGTIGALDDVVTEQLDAFRSRDFARAFALSSLQFQQISSVQDLKVLIEDGRHEEVLDSVSHQVVDCRIPGPGQAVAAVTVTGHNGSTVALSYQFVLEEGRWAILMSRPMGTPSTPLEPTQPSPSVQQA